MGAILDTFGDIFMGLSQEVLPNCESVADKSEDVKNNICRRQTEQLWPMPNVSAI